MYTQYTWFSMDKTSIKTFELLNTKILLLFNIYKHKIGNKEVLVYMFIIQGKYSFNHKAWCFDVKVCWYLKVEMICLTLIHALKCGESRVSIVIPLCGIVRNMRNWVELRRIARNLWARNWEQVKYTSAANTRKEINVLICELNKWTAAGINYCK